MDAIARALDRDWASVVRPGRGLPVAKCPAWADAEPALQGHALVEIPGLVQWCGYRPCERGAGVLSALLRQAADTLAARALLQALLPRLRSENVYTPTFGHRLSEHDRDPADTAADLVAECFVAICRHAGEDRTGVDRLLVQQSVRRLRTARQGVHRYRSRTAVLSGDVPEGASELYSAARSGQERLASAVVEATRNGSLELDEARLIYATRVQGLPASEVGRHYGFAPRAVYYALARAERALLGEVA